MQKHNVVFLSLMTAFSSLSIGNAFATQTLRADESLTPAAGFHTYDGRIGHPLQSTSKAAASSNGIGSFNTLSLWGGYIGAQPGHTETLAFGYFNIPSVSCNSTNNLFAPWIGLDGGLYPDGTGVNQYVEQAGVAISCATGQPTIQAWYEMYPAAPVYISTSAYPIHPNDVVGVTVQNNLNGTYALALSNFGPGGWTGSGTGRALWTFQTTQSGGWSGASLSGEAVVESPTHSYPSFGTVTFENLGGTTQPSNCVNLFYAGTGTGNNQPCAAGTTAPTLVAYNAGNGGFTETSTGGISYLASNVPSWLYNNVTFNESFVHP